MKLSDYVAEFLADLGCTKVFGMSGGAAVHLFDSLSRQSGIDCVFVQDEQAAAMAADGYVRACGRIGVALTTSGPGATNLLTGICCSYYDSIPTLMITGQVASFRIKKDEDLRQKGFQETDIVAMAKPVTKLAVQLDDPSRIRYELERLLWTANEGRPGPVLLDIPDDFQRAEIDETNLEGFEPKSGDRLGSSSDREISDETLNSIKELMESAERPVCILGAGLFNSVDRDSLSLWLKKWGAPFVLTWGAKALFASNHNQNAGLVGICGSRAANFTVQNADLIIVLGSRMSQNVTGGKTEWFARAARVVVVDLDKSEINKFHDLKIEIIPIHGCAGEFIRNIDPQPIDRSKASKGWLSTVQHWKAKYHFLPEVSAEPGVVDAVRFSKKLSEHLNAEDTCILDTGGTLSWFCHGFEVKAGQKIFSAWNFTPMGYALPASIGAALATPGKRIICVTGDGGLLLCLPELATAARHNLPIIVCLYNNHGHGIQKHTLKTWLNGRYVGVDEPSGLKFPDFKKVAEAFGWAVLGINSEENMDTVLEEAISMNGPVLIDVEILPDQPMAPMLTFGRPLEDQHPLLPREELDSIMQIPSPRID